MNSLDERSLTYLSTTVSCGSVRAAADKLNINASVISRQIVQMEQTLATALIERHSRGVRPTPAADVLLDFHRRQRSDREDTLAKLSELRSLHRGHIDVELGEGFMGDLMSGIMPAFWARHPNLTVMFNAASTNDVMRRVSEGAAHIGLVYNPPPDPQIRTQAAYRQPIRAVTRPDHPLAKRAMPLLLRDVAAFPVGLLHPEFGIRQIIASAEKAEGTRLPARITTNSILMLKQFAAEAGGVTLLPAFAAAQEIAQGRLTALPMAHPVLNDVEARVITRLGRHLPAAAIQLLKHVASALGKAL